MPPSSTVHGAQHDTKYVTFEPLMNAAFVADEIWGFVLGLALKYTKYLYYTRHSIPVWIKKRRSKYCSTQFIKYFEV